MDVFLSDHALCVAKVCDMSCRPGALHMAVVFGMPCLDSGCLFVVIVCMCVCAGGVCVCGVCMRVHACAVCMLVCMV